MPLSGQRLLEDRREHGVAADFGIKSALPARRSIAP
jgi:hypothetical protein